MCGGSYQAIIGSMNAVPENDLADPASERVERVLVRDLIASWQSDFGVDVARLFAHVEHIDLLRDRETGLMRFEPAIEGDAAFYQAMRAFDWYHPPHKEEFAAAAAWLREDGCVLDVGVGGADFARYVPRAAYCGLETDDQAVRKAVAEGLDLRCLDMADYLTSDGFRSADLVTAFQVLEHVRDPMRFVRRMAEIAGADGRVAIGVPDACSYVSGLPDFVLNAPPHHVTWWSEAALGAVMAQAGLNVAGVYRFGVEPWERQLWWMAKLARLGRDKGGRYFGKPLRARKVASFLGSGVLQKLPIPKAAHGATLLMIGEKGG